MVVTAAFVAAVYLAAALGFVLGARDGLRRARAERIEQHAEFAKRVNAELVRAGLNPVANESGTGIRP